MAVRKVPVPVPVNNNGYTDEEIKTVLDCDPNDKVFRNWNNKLATREHWEKLYVAATLGKSSSIYEDFPDFNKDTSLKTIKREVRSLFINNFGYSYDSNKFLNYCNFLLLNYGLLYWKWRELYFMIDDNPQLINNKSQYFNKKMLEVKLKKILKTHPETQELTQEQRNDPGYVIDFIKRKREQPLIDNFNKWKDLYEEVFIWKPNHVIPEYGVVTKEKIIDEIEQFFTRHFWFSREDINEEAASLAASSDNRKEDEDDNELYENFVMIRDIFKRDYAEWIKWKALYDEIIPEEEKDVSYNEYVPDDFYKFQLDIHRYLRDQTNYEGDDSYESMSHKVNKIKNFKKNPYNIKDIKEWEDNINKPSGKVDAIMEQLNTKPEKWSINFDELTNADKKLMFPMLKQFFEEKIDKLELNKYKISYRVGKEWHTKFLSPEVFRKIMKNFTEENFIFDIEEIPPDYFYESGGEELPNWSLFSEIRFGPFVEGDPNKNKRRKQNKNDKEPSGTYEDKGGHFFTYLVTENVPKIIKDYLIKLQIFETLLNEKGDKQRSELDDCCFVYALKQSGKISKEDLDKIRLRVNSRYLSNGKLQKICDEFNIALKLKFIDDNKHDKITFIPNQETVKNAAENTVTVLNVYHKHYFLEERTPFSYYYINNFSKLDESYFNKEPKNDKYYRISRSYMTSSQLVKELFKQNYFKPMCYGDVKLLKTVFHDQVDKDLSDIDLNFNEAHCTRLIAPKKRNITNYSYWYADFESDVSGDIHKPFMCVIQSSDGLISKTFSMDNVVKELLEFIPNNSVIYFHNLAYDIRMICSCCEGVEIKKSVNKGASKTFCFNISFMNKNIMFKDTLSILSCKLSMLPQMFDLGMDLKKEIFPYKYYTLERLRENKGIISECGVNEDEPWKDDEYKLFNENIDKIGCRLSEDSFDMLAYAEFYCKQDVNILRLGFNALRAGFIDDFKLDPYDFLTISSLSNEVFNKRVYFGNDLYELGGNVRLFCSQAIRGGRCMTAYNKKYYVDKTLDDFDAVNLYGSAMARLYTVRGKPNVITKDNLEYNWLKEQSAYIVEIKITKINKHYPFPLICTKKDGINTYDDEIDLPINIVVDNITLEDLIEFQKIEFEIIKGYYWDGERDYTIQNVIKEIFLKRAEYKKQKNPLEQLYKLVMNSCYGKTIQRPINKHLKYIREGEALEKFWIKNHNKIIDDIKIDGSNIHIIEVSNQIDNHFNFTLLGIHVLAMSKRIMNEVMCLASDINCEIYYQDTDSMHICCEDIDRLSNAFKEKYDRELIGKDLGQFHNDFACINGHEDMPVSIESYFISKKLYIDKVQDKSGDVDYHIRGKGLTQKSIKAKVDEEYDGNPMLLYKALYEGESIEFDLTKGQPCFKMHKNLTVSTLNKFVRRICVS